MPSQSFPNGQAMRLAELHLITALANFWLSDPGQVTSPRICCFLIRKMITIKSLYPRVWWWLKWETTCENISWTTKCNTNIIMIIVHYHKLTPPIVRHILPKCEHIPGTNYKLQNKLSQVPRTRFSSSLNSLCICFSIFVSCCFKFSTYMVAKKKETN